VLEVEGAWRRQGVRWCRGGDRRGAGWGRSVVATRRQDAGNDYGEWHPVGFGGDGLGNGPHLDAVVVLGVRIAADAVEARRRSLTKYNALLPRGLRGIA
jgi:hypothetical protein